MSPELATFPSRGKIRSIQWRRLIGPAPVMASAARTSDSHARRQLVPPAPHRRSH